MCSAPSGSTDTLKTPFSRTSSAILDVMFRHTKTVGGSAETEQNADTVAPCRPAAPSVVTTQTLLATQRMAAIKSSRSTLCIGGFPVVVIKG
jgi:hypothetical protein